ncbi:histidine--tRNA ligase [Nonomuraea sp. KC401]|uniref:histidine--tRNA ligase n=1 Tax=unclassified Nonomuraea TaxID=2593643 RepID=UPI0010FDB267|nr:MULTISPECIES: histidine--tRNA ligase [unclassified Nonomuraea]NBE99453.1 histidine--tRNA ligase [Nonomuraea sp. K271]TLF57372.1 histidine--tRNA ligase [Nonomuraea sp. KC401]
MSFQAPKGTFDWLPPRSERILAVREALAAPLREAGYGYIETPVFEDTQLFARGVGESTDIVSKEMYTFPDKAGRSLTLRPEGTASVVRAVLQHNLHAGQLPVKLWYSGSQFRYERAQKGRYRHFWQVGAEALGSEDPALDAELIVLGARGFASLGLENVRLLLNSLGDKTCRPAYRAALQEFLRGLDLDADTKARIEINPLRVLDDKRSEVQAQLTGAPLVVDHLCAACKAYHEEVRFLLTASGIAFEDDPRLVRGLDYYTRTTFEFVHDGLGSQSAVGGGGRYDGLSEMLDGPPLPSVGWALGVDRTFLAMEAEGLLTDHAQARVQVYGVPLGDEARRRMFLILNDLRVAGVSADMAFGGKGLKGAMKGAGRSGAGFALILGERDLAAEVAQVKNLTTAEQTEVPLAQVVDVLKGKVQ